MSTSWEATSRSAIQEIPNIIGNVLLRILSQMYGLGHLPNESARVRVHM
jgi:hypothetical protein